MDDQEPAITLDDPAIVDAEVATCPVPDRTWTSPAHRRRAERRQATYEDLLARSRRALEEGRPLSLRAIAAEMGLTAPALYRYIDSHAALTDALASIVYDELVDTLEEAASAYGDGEEGLIAAMLAFRSWALQRPQEFRLLFAPTVDPQREPDPAETRSWATRLAVQFLPRVVALYRLGVLTPPAVEDLPAGALEAIHAVLPQWFPEGDAPELPPGLIWSGVRHWTLLCGTVGVEVQELLGPSQFDGGAMFREVMHATAAYLGYDRTGDALDRVMGAELNER